MKTITVAVPTNNGLMTSLKCIPIRTLEKPRPRPPAITPKPTLKTPKLTNKIKARLILIILTQSVLKVSVLKGPTILVIRSSRLAGDVLLPYIHWLKIVIITGLDISKLAVLLK